MLKHHQETSVRKSHLMPTGWKIVGCIAAIILISVQTFAQSIPQAKIRGCVMDGATHQPVFFANVFLANTTRGAATQEDGSYLIEFIPLGSYKIVVSMMGYVTKSVDITLEDLKTREYNFTIYPKPIDAPELSISARTPREWRRNRDRFLDLFIGTSKFARQCKILNQEIMEFEVDDRVGTFEATADEPLIIENKALGYKIHFHLQEFIALSSGIIRYLGQTRFEPMEPQNQRERNKWIRNREEAYFGSRRHFFATAFKGAAETVGYRVFNVKDIMGDEDIMLKEVTMDSLIIGADQPYQKVLKFDDYLKIVYTEATVSHRERGFIPLGGADHQTSAISDYQTSALQLNVNFATFNALGIVDNPYALTSLGHWAIQYKFAEMLPLDYIP